MATTTNLNVSPYFDDFDETKNFYRVLFKPSTPVQTRELNQLQTMLQNQIERFGNSVYKDGAVISGCNISFYEKLDYVRIMDQSSDGLLLDVRNFVGKTIESSETGLRANILTVKSGTNKNFPWTNRLYLQYLNSGFLDEVQYQKFRQGETLTIYDNPRTDNVAITEVVGYNDQSTGGQTASIGYGVKVGDGMIYQKGYFVRTEEQTLVVSDSINPGNAVVGFITNETIVNAEQDESLYDNALGYVNPNAPGADRLKLVANLSYINADDLSTTSDFTSIVQFLDGIPIIENPDDRYSTIGKEMDRRQFETNGSFVVKPFKVNTVSANTDFFTAQISSGSGYAQGHRVELVRTAPVNVRRGTDTQNLDTQLITTNYGNYILVNEMSGVFDFDRMQEIEIYDSPQQALSNKTFSNTGLSGSKIGVANVRCIKLSSGVPGTPSAQYEVYLFNIRMTAGKSFSAQARSVRYGTSPQGIADIVSVNGLNLFNSERRAMLWNFGTSAIKTLKDSSNNINTQYVVRTRATSTMGVNGQIALTLTTSHAGGTNQFPYGLGIIGNDEAEFTVVTHAATQSTNLGNVSVSNTTVNASGSSFTTLFSPNEYILFGTNEVKRIVSIANNTSMQVDTPFASANTAVPYSKYFPAGYQFPLEDTMVGTRTINVTSPTSVVINTGASVAGALTTSVPVSIYHNILRYNALPAKKKINKGIIVKIDTSSHPNKNKGPWNLGLTDVHELRKVGVDASFTDNASNLSTLFYYDSGQKDTHYDYASLYLRPGESIPEDSKIIVVVDTFTVDTTSGVGFLSIDSYPIDDRNSANTTAITTANIPVYVSESGVAYKLRDCIDFRPYKTNVSNLTTSLSEATINPSNSLSAFVLDTVGAYVPCPDETFQADLTFYVGRKENIYFSNLGYLKTKAGLPSINPRTPPDPDDGMSIAVLNVPPFPSLTSEEVSSLSEKNRSVYSNVRDTSSPIAISIVTNKRYRMEDIGKIDQRLTRAEYYMTLNMLEQATTSLQVSDKNGLDRFKNGIFVDPFTNFTLADVSNPEFKIALDGANGIVRPFFNEERPELDFDLNSSTAITKTGRLITLPYRTVKFAEQPFGTSYRSAASLQFRWNGQITLYPTYGHNIDKVAAAAVNVSIDLATPWQDFANSPFGMSYGDWRVTGQDVSTASAVTGQSSLGNSLSTTTTTTATTTTTSSRDVQKLSVGTNTTTYDLGNFVEDISVQPYMASTEISFYAFGMRPSTRLYVYFDNANVSSQSAPGIKNPSTNDTSSSNYVLRTAAYGTPMMTNADGEIYGKFLLPSGTFRVGERTLLLSDIADLSKGKNSQTTSASATYVASNFTVTTKNVTISTVNPVLNSTGSSQTRVSSSTSTSANTVTTVTVPTPVVTPTTPTVDPVPTVTQPPPVLTVDPPVNNPPTITLPCGVTYILSEFERAVDIEIQNMISLGSDASFIQRDLVRTMIANLFCSNPNLTPDDVYVLDPIAQQFRIDLNNGASGMFLSSIDVFFQNKASNQQTGVTMYISEVINGNPNTSTIVPFSLTHLNWNQVIVSENGTAATRFNFESPVFLTNGQKYVFVIVPDGGDPDYRVWTATLGDRDVATNTQVSSKPYIDPAFVSTNQNTWTALQDEYIKFTINRCDFVASSGTASFTTRPTDYFTVSSVVNSNTSSTIQISDMVYAMNGDNIITSSNGQISDYYVANGFMEIANTSGTFSDVATIQVHRLPNDGAVPNANTRIATASINNIVDVKMNAIVPRFATLQPSGTSMVVGFRSSSNSYVLDGGINNCAFDTETELFDYERLIVSRSNENKFVGGNKLFGMQIGMATDSSFMSPAIDVIRANFLAISNIIDPTSYDTTKEYDNFGPCKNKYVSKIVTLANGQDSEDLQVYLTAYKPLGSKIRVYGKFLSGEDTESIINKTWTELEIDDDTVYSNYRNVTDYRELVFTVPRTLSSNIPATSAYVDEEDGLYYSSSSGAKFNSFKAFQLKIVLLSDSTAVVPRLNDVRALAMLM